MYGKTINSDKLNKAAINTTELSGTTTSTGALAIPSNIANYSFISLMYHSTKGDQHIGFIFRRDLSYFTCLDNSLAPVSSKSVTITYSYFNANYY